MGWFIYIIRPEPKAIFYPNGEPLSIIYIRTLYKLEALFSERRGPVFGSLTVVIDISVP